MNLHRSYETPDWADVAAAELTMWQRLAKATHGVVTPGNILTLMGFVILLGGLYAIMQHYYLVGAIGLIVGRAFDILDGWAAEQTRTKSPLGEAVDAVSDKFGTLFTLVVFFITDLAPWWVFVALLLPHLIITIIVFVGRFRQKKIHPSRLGKISMAALWVGLAGLLLTEVLGLHGHNALLWMSYFVIAASVVAGIIAAYRYAQPHR